MNGTRMDGINGDSSRICWLGPVEGVRAGGVLAVWLDGLVRGGTWAVPMF